MLEDGLQRKNLKLESCIEFFSAPKYRRPNMDDGNTRVYIKIGNLGQRAPRYFLPLGSRLEGEINLHSTTISNEEVGGQGPLPPRAVAVGIVVAVAVAAAAVSFISSGLNLSI